MRLDFEPDAGLIYSTNPVTRKTYTFMTVVLMSAAFGGCFAWNYVKEGYDNFSAYFNTFYNATVSFNDGMKDVQQTKRDYDLSVIAGDHPAPFAISQKAKQDFNETIVEASKVLQYHPHSEFTEESLFMIGISYYYQGDNLRGERKFLEIESTFPDTKRLAEAEMYYGGMEIRGMKNETGRDRVLHAIRIARREGKRPVVAMSSEILADYYLREGDTLSAAAYLDTASVFSDGDQASIYACRAGRLFSEAQEYGEAVRTFTRAANEARGVQEKFYSRYYLSRVYRLMGDYSVALDGLHELLRNDNFFEYFPLVKYQQATVLYDSGEVSTAVIAYEDIDTAYSSNTAATLSAYKLASIYLRLVGDFQNALKYYQRVTSHPNVYMISDSAQQMARTLQDYLIASYKVVLNDSMYYHAAEAVQRNDTTFKYTKDKIDSLYEHAADSRDELAGLFLFKLQMPDSAVKSYRIVLQDFPNSRVYPSALYSLGEYYYSSGDTAKGREYLDELVKEHRESPFAVSACSVLGIPPPVVIDSAQVRYDEAMALSGKGEYTAAVDTLKELISRKKSPLAPKALYTLGWIFENKLQQPDSAFVYYRQLSTEFGSTDYGENVKLAVAGFEQAQRDSVAARKARADSIAAAEKLKEKADSLHAGQHDASPAEGGIERGTAAHPDSLRAPAERQDDTTRVRKEPSHEMIKHGKR